MLACWLQDRSDLIEQLEKRPDAMWRTGTIWSFKVSCGKNRWLRMVFEEPLVTHGGRELETAGVPHAAWLQLTSGFKRFTEPPTLAASTTAAAQNDLKVYGTPALDAVWDCATGNKPAPMAANPLPGVLAELRSVDVPWRLQVAVGGGSSKGARGKKK